MIGETNRRIARNFSIVIVFIFLAKLVGAAKEMAVAWRYGVSSLIDAFIFSNAIIIWLPMILTGILATVIVPLSAQLHSKKDNNSSDLFFSELSGLIIMVGLVITLATAVLYFFPIIYPQIIESDSRYLVLVMAPCALFMTVTGLITARLIASEKFVNSLLEAIPTFSLLVAVIILIGDRTTLIIGTNVGAFLACAISCAYAYRLNLIELPKYSFTSPHWKTFWSGIGVLTIGQVLMSMVTLIDPYMLAELGEGAIASLGYANRVLALILTLGATAISRAILPVLSEKVASGDIASARKLAWQWSYFLFFIAIVGCSIAWWFAPIGIQILFERGAFSAKNTTDVSEVFRFGLLQVPFYFSGIVLVQLLASNNKFSWIAIGAALNLPVKFYANLILGPIYGASGIALATGAMYLGSVIFLIFAVYMDRAKI